MLKAFLVIYIKILLLFHCMFTDNSPLPYDSLSYHFKNVINKCFLEKKQSSNLFWLIFFLL